MKTSFCQRLLLAAGLLMVASAGAQTYSRTEVVTYRDDNAKWVLGQVASITCTASVPQSDSCDGDVIASTTFHSATVQPESSSAFGKLKLTWQYNNDGTLASERDGNNNVTTFSGWKRGIPQSIRYPATPETPAGATRAAVINAAGLITQLTDENGYQTNYAYDAMGRLASVSYPTGDTPAWAATTQVFHLVATAEYGIPAGHWRQTVRTGSALRVTYFDALLRPLVTQEYDASDEAATQRFQRFAYDHDGLTTFASYMGTSNALTTGTHTTYDALGRVRQVRQDWEGAGQLVTTTDYLSNADGHYTLVTNPRQRQTHTWFQAYDQPSYDTPRMVWHPEGAFTHITRDPHSKPTRIRRSDSSSPTGGTKAADRTYAYDVHQQLCRSVEPETGATLMGYDGAGNLSWSAAGLAAGTACHPTGDDPTISARKAIRTYDGRGNLRTLRFPDNRGDQSWTYTPDGLPASASTIQAGVTAPTLNEYRYNRRRLLTSEHQTPYASETWSLSYNYNANGQLASATYPSGLSVEYQPNALGQPTRAGSFATGVSYHPNGAVKQFTFGNGIVHTMAQNARGLPDTRCDFYGTCSPSSTLNEGYDYDQNGNVAAISDGLTGSRGDRTMSYDGLDRLTGTTSPMFGIATYSYDVLDNITRAAVGTTAASPAKDHFYCYDARWHLTNLKTGSCAGNTVIGVGYDAQGNLANKNGVAHEFDFGNRLRRISTGRSYTYDAYGRRVTETIGQMNPQRRRLMYGINGQLVYESSNTGYHADNIHLGGRVIARRIRPFPTTTPIVRINYQHTDALGSPVAITDESRVVLERTEYDPFGQPGNRSVRHGVGFTGHVEDTSGLVYMQQRYYDPAIGRFLSVDPVQGGGQRNFNRYSYAANNPYRFTDPDGRDCVSQDSVTTCTVPVVGSLIPTKISFESPGVSGRFSSSSPLRHLYDLRTPHQTDDGTVQQQIVRDPSPGNDRPATPRGTPNKATPPGLRGLMAKAGVLHGNDPTSPIKSYSATDQNGNTWVINVTQPGHGLHFGYVLRGSVNGEVITIGEGWAKVQTVPYLSGYINDVWKGHNQRNIDDAQ